MNTLAFISLIITTILILFLFIFIDKTKTNPQMKNSFIFAIICLLICLFAYPLIRYTYGFQYLAAVSILQITIFKEIGYACAQASGTMIIIEGIQKYAVLRNLIGCVINITLNLFLIPNYQLLYN